jgi:hypothetical protein
MAKVRPIWSHCFFGSDIHVIVGTLKVARKRRRALRLNVESQNVEKI